MKLIITVVFLIIPIFVMAHGDEQHDGDASDDGWEIIKEEVPREVIEKINENYLANVKPIFKLKCLDCHGSDNALPWYAYIPGPNQLIRKDIREAKEHMDMSNDFPFAGHGNPKDDLKALKRTVKEGNMPPFQYKLLHWSSSLNEDEKKLINKWIKDSLESINKPNEEKK